MADTKGDAQMAAALQREADAETPLIGTPVVTVETQPAGSPVYVQASPGTPYVGQGPFGPQAQQPAGYVYGDHHHPHDHGPPFHRRPAMFFLSALLTAILIASIVMIIWREEKHHHHR